MPSKAWVAFEKNASDVSRLLEIHRNIGGSAQGRRYRLEVLNKSAIVLITAIWEAYCEDLAGEALKRVVKRSPRSDALPMELRRTTAKELKGDPHELAVWRVADKGWRTVLMDRLARLTEDRNRRLNTPKAQNIIELFKTTLGLVDVSARWRWKRMSSAQAKAKLDKYVELRRGDRTSRAGRG